MKSFVINLQKIVYILIILVSMSVPAYSQSLLIVERDNSEVNALSDYYLNFQTNIGDYARINKGQLILTLPNGFSVAELDSVEIIDDYKHINYTIKKIENDVLSTRLFLNRDRSHDDDDDDDDDNGLSNIYPDDTTVIINVSVRLSKIHNPSKSGDYQLSLVGLRKNQKIAIGPLLSEPFSIIPGSIYTINVTPSEDFQLQAGEEQHFSATAFDQYGNKIEGTVFEWSLDPCFESIICIGEFIDSTLFVTKTGRATAQASAGGVTGSSGLITVIPSELHSITLDMHRTQFVGNEIRDGRVILYDNFGNLKSDHDLTASPIEIIASGGELINNILDDNQFQVGGVIKLKDFNTTYVGMSGLVSMRAENDSIQMTGFQVYLAVNFNNYDIIDLQDSSNETVHSLKTGETITADLLIQNNGNLRADTVIITSYWQSQPEIKTKTSIIPSDVTLIDEVPIFVTPVLPAGSFDKFVIRTESKFIVGVSVNGNMPYTITTIDEKQFTVEILEDSKISLNVESIRPDTIQNQIPFELSFDVNTENLNQAIDSTHLTVTVVGRNFSQVIGSLYNGNPDYHLFQNEIISYKNIEAVLNTELDLPNGWYPIVFEYQLFSNNTKLTPTKLLNDSIYIFFDHGISLVEGSLTPKIVFAGTNVFFEFSVNLENDISYSFHGPVSKFKIYDGSFSTSTNLFLENDSLHPGLNILRSASISIQPEQVGSDLFAEAMFNFCVPGLHDTLTFLTSFTETSVPIQVIELPIVQILDLEVIAPNAPIVNSSQEIQFKATIANLSGNVIDSLHLELKSIDGYSTINVPMKTSLQIQPFDTITMFFDVTASSVSQTLPESFRVDIYDNSIGMTVPINNSAFLIIEDEALLEFSHRINGIENADGFVVGQGDNLHIQINVANVGTAKVANGMYQFVVNGLTANVPDTFTGLLFPDSSIDFGFVAPLLDTVINFEFSVIQEPVDINYNTPAKLLNEKIKFSILSVSNNAEIVVETNFLQTNLVLPGRAKELFELTFTNNSNSSLNSLQVDIIDLNLFNMNHDFVHISDVINTGKSYFSEDGQKVSTTTSGGNQLMFWISDFIVAPKQSKTLQLVVEFKETANKELILEILQSDIKAIYIDGPNNGQEVIVKSVNGGNKILSYQIVLKGSSLNESFIIENNPFNPMVSPVQFAFELTKAAPIEFQMFTLTGEEVYRYLYPAGTEGASIGENIIRWDGYNNAGNMVLNGVYIASIKNTVTGEQARIKVAVVK